MAATAFDYTATYSLHYAFAKDIEHDELRHHWHHKVPGTCLRDLIVKVRQRAAANPNVNLSCIEAVQESDAGGYTTNVVFRWIAA